MTRMKGIENVKFETGAGPWKMVPGIRYFIEPETGDVLEVDKPEKGLLCIRASEGPLLEQALGSAWKLYQGWIQAKELAARKDAVALLIVRHDEKMSAALVEARIRNLRQAYAALVIAFGSSAGETFAVDGVDIDSVSDLELLLPEEYRLVIVGAGVGSFGLIVKKAVEVASKAPGKALDALSLFFKWGRDTGKIRAEALAGIKQAEKEAAELKNQRTRDENEKAKKLDKIDIERAEREEKEAADKSAREKIEGEYNFIQKQREDYVDLVKKFSEIPNEVLREKALPGFETNMRLMLPPSVTDKLPPAA